MVVYLYFQTGLMYWPVVQAVNFSAIPPDYRTSRYMPVCSFLWTIYLCYMKEEQQNVSYTFS